MPALQPRSRPYPYPPPPRYRKGPCPRCFSRVMRGKAQAFLRTPERGDSLPLQGKPSPLLVSGSRRRLFPRLISFSCSGPSLPILFRSRKESSQGPLSHSRTGLRPRFLSTPRRELIHASRPALKGGAKPMPRPPLQEKAISAHSFQLM